MGRGAYRLVLRLRPNSCSMLRSTHHFSSPGEAVVSTSTTPFTNGSPSGAPMAGVR